MNQYLQQFLYSGVRMLTAINCIVIVDGAGNPFPLSPDVQGNLVKSVEHIGPGQYKIHLKEPQVAGVLNLFSPISGPGDAPSGITVESSESGNVADPSDPQVTVNCFNSAGTLTDPSSTSGFSALILCRNSTVKY